MSIEGERSDLDTERFIVEVQSRPALWDMNDGDYSSREMKRKNWEELVALFSKKDVVSHSEKNELGRQLQRKWKSLRDCYSRERQRLAKMESGSSVPRKTQYVFYHQLSFLQTAIRSRDTTSNGTEEEAAAVVLPPPAAAEEEEEEEKEEAASVDQRQLKPNSRQRRVKRRRVDDSAILSEVQSLARRVRESGVHSREERERRKEEEETDGDRLFLLSLLEPTKKIPEHLRLGVRMQIMQLIHEATNQGGASSPRPPTPPSPAFKQPNSPE